MLVLEVSNSRRRMHQKQRWRANLLLETVQQAQGYNLCAATTEMLLMMGANEHWLFSSQFAAPRMENGALAHDSRFYRPSSPAQQQFRLKLGEPCHCSNCSGLVQSSMPVDLVSTMGLRFS
jgi:hypothetical protein